MNKNLKWLVLFAGLSLAGCSRNLDVYIAGQEVDKIDRKKVEYWKIEREKALVYHDLGWEYPYNSGERLIYIRF